MASDNDEPRGGLAFAAGDIRTDLATRRVGIKWVVVVDAALPPGLMANAVACTAAAVGGALPEIVGRGGTDAAGTRHSGLPWIGCSILGASAEQVREVRSRAIAMPGVLVAEMSAIAQRARIYDDFLAALGASHPEELDFHAAGIVGPRRAVDKLVGRLPLLR